MTLIPATYLAGSLLSLLLPVILLIALVVWYVWFIRRVPENTEQIAPDPAPDVAAPAEPPAA
jgi:hypothetical protein